MSETMPITRGGQDRGYKPCVCSACGYIDTCTPDNDFYTLEGASDGPLFCEACFRKEVAKRLSGRRNPK